MTYKEWVTNHNKERSKILSKLHPDEVQEYFMYSNMKEKESDFCPLYKLNQKCHHKDSDKDYSCYFCACPYFMYKDIEDGPLYSYKNEEVYSKCAISSRNAVKFQYEVENKIFTQCDCSNCILPHTTGFIKQFTCNEQIEDTYSLLDMIRGEQLRSILGKFKIFGS